MTYSGPMLGCRHHRFCWAAAYALPPPSKALLSGWPSTRGSCAPNGGSPRVSGLAFGLALAARSAHARRSVPGGLRSFAGAIGTPGAITTARPAGVARRPTVRYGRDVLGRGEDPSSVSLAHLPRCAAPLAEDGG
jgi:hypothetical protein